MKKLSALFPALLALMTIVSVRADVTPNPLFADHAVLQQGRKIPVWGTADPGERVVVEFAGQNVSVVAGADGKWIVYLEPVAAGGPHTLTISGKNKITFNDVL